MEGHFKAAEDGQLAQESAQVGGSTGPLTESRPAATSSGCPSATLEWPDLHKDAVAMDKAITELGVGESLEHTRRLLQRAQEIKEGL